MAAISEIHNVWRDSLVPASFRGALFHVETSQRQGGRRTVVHEYPKKNIPYSEDMGRSAARWQITGYLIHFDKGFPGNLLSQIAQLNFALDGDDAGPLIHPLLGTMLVMCERWSYSDQRERGGYIQYEMQFVEAGQPAGNGTADTGSQLTDAAGNAENTGVSSINSATAQTPGTAAPGGGIAGTIPP